MFANIADDACPVLMDAKLSLATSTALSMLSSASRRMSSITSVPSCDHLGGDPRPDSLTHECLGHIPMLFEPENDHGQVIVHPEAECGRVEHVEPLLQRVLVRHVLEPQRVRVGARIGGVDRVHPVLSRDDLAATRFKIGRA